MASAVPQIYQEKGDSLLVKNINYFEQDDHLNSKLEEKRRNEPMQSRPTNQKPLQKEKSSIKELKDTMTLEQLQIYEKQKDKVSEIKESKVIIPEKTHEEEEGFELLKVERKGEDEKEFEVKIIRKDSVEVAKESPSKQKKQKKKKKK